MDRQAAALKACETSEPGDEASRARALEAANADRVRSGLGELKTEVEFHRKAVALGLVRR